MTLDQAIRVVIVDDHAVVREGISSLLADCDDMTVVATANGAVEAMRICGDLDVDVALMDISMPGIDGVTATAQLAEHYPEIRVVILTGFVDTTAVRAAVQAGASACLLKTVGKDELAEAIRGVTQGRSTFSSEFLPHLVAPPRTATLAETLTARERDILTLVASGQTNRSIAHALGLSEGTVRVYVSTVLAKLGAANRTEATALAIREGLVEHPP